MTKRLIIALIILTAGSTVFCALQSSSERWRSESAAAREACQAETQLIAQAQIERQSLTKRAHELQQEVAATPSVKSPPDMVTLSASNLPPALREQLLEELGFKWDISKDYLIISKDTLRNVHLNPLRGTQVTEVAADVFAMTKQERTGVEAAAQRVLEQRKQWLTEHIERREPIKDEVAHYVVPIDKSLSENMKAEFERGINAALGPERAELLSDYAYTWMMHAGLNATVSTDFTVRRESGRTDSTYVWSLKNPDGSSSTQGLTPYQFPEVLRPLFPKGWADLAEREGFKLPKEFQKKRQ